MNILKKANDIVNNRSEEKERQYGVFNETMELVTQIFNGMTANKYNCTPEDMYKAMIAMKFAREAHAHKTDNLLDAAAYTGALDNYINRKAEVDEPVELGPCKHCGNTNCPDGNRSVADGKCQFLS